MLLGGVICSGQYGVGASGSNGFQPELEGKLYQLRGLLKSHVELTIRMLAGLRNIQLEVHDLKEVIKPQVRLTIHTIFKEQ